MEVLRAPGGIQGATPLSRGPGGSAPWKLMGFSSPRKPVSEGKIHTITPSLSGLSFDHVLTLLFHAFFFFF